MARFGSHSLVAVPTDGPLVPEAILDMARAAVWEGVPDTFAVIYGTFHYELFSISENLSEFMSIWVIQRWPLTRAEVARGLRFGGAATSAGQAEQSSDV